MTPKKCANCGMPCFGADGYCTACRPAPKGMVRVPDHATSEAAAKKVRRTTIRARVLTFAENMPEGFIDDDLRVINPDAPESSIRKRRSELADDNLILDSGRERMNRKGSMATVWIHRKFHPAPPPESIKVRGARAVAMQRRKREALMFNACVGAAYYAHRLPDEEQQAIAGALAIPFPIRVTEIPAKRPL